MHGSSGSTPERAAPGLASPPLKRYVPNMAANPDVDAWFDELDHPLKDVMQQVRTVILSADSRVTEAIKWKTPTFMYQGNIVSFNPRSRAHVSMLFHTGASIPGNHPRLEGGGDTARYMKIAGLEDAASAAGDIENVIAAWIESKSSRR